MRTIELGRSGLAVPVVGVGCMRLPGLDAAAAERFLRGAIEQGAYFFDHADIYGGGESEALFAKALHMTPQLRETLLIQSKCGIVPGKMYDFSKEHILEAVEGSLQRLRTEYLDVLLLHRPDALMEPEDVAEAFDALYAAGKVRHFGVSNFNPLQIELLKKAVRQPLIANQLQLSLLNASMISAGVHVNTLGAGAVMRDGGVLDYCRLHDITIQPWSPFQHSRFTDVHVGNDIFVGSAKYPELNRKLDELAEKHGVSTTAIALAWILRHPAKMQPIIGTTNAQRLRECLQAADVTLTRAEWYELFLAAGNQLP